MQIASGFAILDITDGHQELENRLGFSPGNEPVEVTIKARITHAWGQFDGVSQEFAIDVTDIQVEE